MRIRKRFLQSLSATSPQPSDPPLYRYDQITQIGLQVSTWVQPKKMEGERKKELIKTDDTCRNESIVCAEASISATFNSPPKPLTYAHLGDSLSPIKKRRGRFGKPVNHDLEENNQITEETMKPKPNGKCLMTKLVSATNLKKNKKKRGKVLMEGSRCSRVNGRGWRCLQQTLVGYSLCEHHLGKGRLRSMTSVRGRAHKVALKEQETKERQDKEVDTRLTNHHEFEDDVEDEFKDSDAEGKKKLGMVKARSLSSLLSQIGS